MTAKGIQEALRAALTRVAPEADMTTIQPRVSFRDQLDLDSVDFLNFVLALHDTLGIDIPEADYSHLSSLEAAQSYLAARLPDGGTRGH